MVWRRSLTFYLLGKFGNLKAKEISELQAEEIKKYGLIHWTTSTNAESIIKDKCIRKSNINKSYSNNMIECTYFFCAKSEEKENIDLNVSNKCDTYVLIKDLDDEQLKKCKYNRSS